MRASAFAPLDKRVRFISYDTVSEMHAKEFERSLVAAKFDGG